jgi:dihydropteroate synthase
MIDVPLVRGRLRADRCLVMGILNATPNSFSDGGELARPHDLQTRIVAMIAAGADILDVGGESTRPGHEKVSAAQEMARGLPAIAAIRSADAEFPISIDTSKAEVAKAALAAGASLVNDVSGLGDPNMGKVVAAAGCAIVLMRHENIPGELVPGCRNELLQIMARAETAGIPAARMILDPGLGFGERPGASAAENMQLIDALADYSQGLPVLIGGSRKRFVGEMMGESDAKRRLSGSLEVALRARAAGAAIVRVHDVAETVAALR